MALDHLEQIPKFATFPQRVDVPTFHRDHWKPNGTAVMSGGEEVSSFVG